MFQTVITSIGRVNLTAYTFGFMHSDDEGSFTFEIYNTAPYEYIISIVLENFHGSKETVINEFKNVFNTIGSNIEKSMHFFADERNARTFSNQLFFGRGGKH